MLFDIKAILFLTYLIFLEVAIAHIIPHKYTLQKGKYYLTFILGNNNNYEIFKPINQNSRYTTTIIPFDVLDNPHNKDNNYKRIELKFDHQIHSGLIMTAKLTIPKTSIIIHDFDYYYFERIYEHPFLNCIGLGYNTKGKAYSLLYQLYKNNHINHLSYSLSSLDTSHNNGTLYYGGIPNEMIKGKHKGSCSIAKNQSNWSCNILSVTIDSNNYVYNATNDYSFFQVHQETIKAPSNFISNLTEIILYPLIIQGKCFICDPMVYNVLKCFNSVRGLLPIFSFDFGKSLLLKVDMNNLLECNKSGVCDLMIEEHKLKENEWVFGNALLKNFDVHFDEEDDIITFYSHKHLINKSERINIKINNTIFMVMMICIIIEGIGIFLSLFIIHNMKK